MTRQNLIVVLLCVACTLATAGEAGGDDWPEFRGEWRRGVWRETGVLEK